MLNYAEFLIEHPMYLLIVTLILSVASIIALFIEVRESRRTKR